MERVAQKVILSRCFPLIWLPFPILCSYYTVRRRVYYTGVLYYTECILLLDCMSACMSNLTAHGSYWSCCLPYCCPSNVTNVVAFQTKHRPSYPHYRGQVLQGEAMFSAKKFFDNNVSCKDQYNIASCLSHSYYRPAHNDCRLGLMSHSFTLVGKSVWFVVQSLLSLSKRISNS